MKLFFKGITQTLLALSLTGMSAAGFAENIVVGQIGPFTGLPSPDASEINQGAQAYFDQINAAGGVGGKKIEFFKLDDKFNGDEFVRQVEVAAAKKPIALITPIGSGALQRAIKDNLFEKYDFVIVNAVPGADIFRNPGHPRLFHIRASDGQQIAKIVRHARTVGIAGMQVLHQDLPIGTAGLAVAKETGASFGMKIDSVLAKHDEAELASGAARVKQANPESVLVIGTTKYMADAVNHLRKAGVLNTIFALSYMPAPMLTKIAGEANARGVAVSQTYPNPMSRASEVVREFQATMKKHAPAITTYSTPHFEGYMSARVLVEALKRGGAASASRLARTLREMGPLDLGGFTVDFSKSNAGSDFVDIAVVTTGGKLMY